MGGEEEYVKLTSETAAVWQLVGTTLKYVTFYRLARGGREESQCVTLFL